MICTNALKSDFLLDSFGYVFTCFCVIDLTNDINYASILFIQIAKWPLDSTDQLPNLVLLALYIDRFQINNIIQRRQGAVWVIHFRATCDNFLPVWKVKGLPTRIHTVYHGMVEIESHICVTIC